MDQTAYDGLLGVIDDAIDLAALAVKSAEEARKSPQEPVTLVKVARSRFQAAADVLHKTGTFREYTREGLAKSLEEAGTSGLLDFMEKLASMAVFPLDTGDITGVKGDLVDKPTTAKANDSGRSRTDLWAQSMEEAGF